MSFIVTFLAIEKVDIPVASSKGIQINNIRQKTNFGIYDFVYLGRIASRNKNKLPRERGEYG